MIPQKAFETKSLFLRKSIITDSYPIFENYAQDPEVARYTTWSPHASIETTKQFISQCLLDWKKTVSFPYVICLKGTDEPIGMIHPRFEKYKAEFGYVLARSFWNKGYMTEALTCLIDWYLEQPEIYRVWAFCDCENRASARIMEKAGMEFEGVLRRWHIAPCISNEPRDCMAYAKIK